jgi:hypothetical protein
MKSRTIISASLALCAAFASTGAAYAEPNKVTFPEDLEALELYTTVTRGNIFENVYTSREALDAIQQGEDLPNGTQVVLEIFRDEELWRLFVMEKGEGWGEEYDEASRTGDWQFQWYWPDGTINMEENTARCRSCHMSREDRSYMFTYNDARRAE